MESEHIENLTSAIISSGGALLREAGRLFKPYRISAAQFNVLNVLAEARQGMSSTALAKELVVDPSSATYVVDRMVELGWVKREEDPEDRRAWCIGLTPLGRKFHGQVAPLYLAALREMARGLDPQVIVPLTAALHEIQRAAHGAVSTILASSPDKKRQSHKQNRS